MQNNSTAFKELTPQGGTAFSRGETKTLENAGPNIATGNDELGGGGGRIRCPICGWQPDPSSRWTCSCKHSWNTFETGGVCPACLQRWAYTACPNCGSWSPHSDWYQSL